MMIGISQGKYFDELSVGEEFSSSLTVTETHLVLSTGIFGDFNPVHVNEEFVKASPFGKRIVPGPLTVGIMAAALGNYFAGSAHALLAISVEFKYPVAPGDTLTSLWQVVDKQRREKWGGGEVRLKGSCRNQDQKVVAEGESKVLVKFGP